MWRLSVMALSITTLALLPTQTVAVSCGDGITEWAELCDDGNTVDGDGCSSSCRLEQEPLSCSSHHDCLQGEFCHRDLCRFEVDSPTFHCGKPGCPPGSFCIEDDGTRSVCAEDPSYVCTDASACGPAYACIAVPGVSTAKTCVKDPDDHWRPGDNSYGIDIPPGEPTYTCATPECIVGLRANGGRALCVDRDSGQVRDECGGVRCYSSHDCRPGESCVDTRVSAPTTPPGTLCDQRGGFCTSHALAESVFGWPPRELLAPCDPDLGLSGHRCEAGWTPGGAFAVKRVVGEERACGNAVCEASETAVTCPSDCRCGDGWCDTTEVGTCVADCGICGDDACGRLESPKTCAQDCPVTCGDGSCDASEVSSCPADCQCGPQSVAFDDNPAFCGDGVCQADGVLAESCVTCSRDCGAPTDIDSDGIAHCVDNCPRDSNLDQADFDSDGLGDACDDDDDNDEVLDGFDSCPDTPAGEVVNVDGCAIAQLCPCENRWKNHGAYISCVAHAAEDFVADGLITEAEKDVIVSEAGGSSCGHKQ